MEYCEVTGAVILFQTDLGEVPFPNGLFFRLKHTMNYLTIFPAISMDSFLLAKTVGQDA